MYCIAWWLIVNKDKEVQRLKSVKVDDISKKVSVPRQLRLSEFTKHSVDRIEGRIYLLSNLL